MTPDPSLSWVWPDTRDLPRAVWVVLPDGRRTQIWVDRHGVPVEAPIPPELDFEFRPINLSRVVTPTMGELQLAALLTLCQG